MQIQTCGASGKDGYSMRFKYQYISWFILIFSPCVYGIKHVSNLLNPSFTHPDVLFVTPTMLVQ